MFSSSFISSRDLWCIPRGPIKTSSTYTENKDVLLNLNSNNIRLQSSPAGAGALRPRLLLNSPTSDVSSAVPTAPGVYY